MAVARKGQALLSSIAKEIGISEGSPANWMKKADIEDGHRPGWSTPTMPSCAKKWIPARL